MEHNRNAIFQKIYAHPFWLCLCAFFLFINMLGWRFGFGEQINHYYNPVDDPCPECDYFQEVKSQIEERQCRIYMSYDPSNDMWPKSNYWRFIRIFIDGPFMKEEMRADDRFGIYSLDAYKNTIHFELFQEGLSTIRTYCLDRELNSVNTVVKPYKRPSEYTLLHENRKMTNICKKDNGFVIFTKSNLIEFKNNTYLGNVLKHERRTKKEYVDTLNLFDIDNAFMIDYKFEDIQKMNDFEVFEKIVLPAYKHSEKGQNVVFKDNQVPKNIKRIVRKFVKGNNFLNQNIVCFKELELISNNEDISMDNNNFNKFYSYIKSNSSLPNKIYLNIGDYSLDFTNITNLTKLTNDDNIVKLLSNSNVLITNENNMINGIWMPPNSTIILIKKDKKVDYENASLKYLKLSNHNVIHVENLEEIIKLISSI